MRVGGLWTGPVLLSGPRRAGNVNTGNSWSGMGVGPPEGPSLWTRTAVMYYSIHFIQRFPTSLLRYLQACSKVLLNVCTWDQLGFDTLRGEPVRVQPAGWRSGKCLGKPFPWHEQWSPKQQWSAAGRPAEQTPGGVCRAWQHSSRISRNTWGGEAGQGLGLLRPSDPEDQDSVYFRIKAVKPQVAKENDY